LSIKIPQFIVNDNAFLSAKAVKHDDLPEKIVNIKTVPVSE